MNCVTMSRVAGAQPILGNCASRIIGLLNNKDYYIGV